VNSNFQAWKARHAGLWQFVMFTLMSMITTLVDLGSFSLFNYLVFARLRDRPFVWWIISYGVDDGGLCAFLAFALSFAISQTFNFFLQRKTTFKANNNVLWSGVMYAVMVIAVYLLQILVPSWILAGVAAIVGLAFGAIIVKFVNMSLSMLIQFPMNKYVIMRTSVKRTQATDGAASPRA